MKKRSCKKSNEQVDIVEEIVNEAYGLSDKGKMMGDSIIGMMGLTSCDYAGVAICAIGLGKAMAAWKSLCTKLEKDPTSLYEEAYNHYLELYNNVLAGEDE